VNRFMKSSWVRDVFLDAAAAVALAPDVTGEILIVLLLLED
jgi:hypothetical protein